MTTSIWPRVRACVWLLTAGAIVAGCQSVGMNNIVAVRAQADPAYAARHPSAAAGADTAPTPAPERPSYVFAQGRFFSTMFDDQVKRVDFDTMTKALAASLSPRFVPAPNPNGADLLLVVHWGAVQRVENSMDNLLYDPDSLRQASEAIDTASTQAAADFRAGNFLAYGQVRAAEANWTNELRVADTVFTSDARVAASAGELIGLRGLYRPDDVSADADALRSLLEDDRYIVTLIAFDAPLLKLKQKRIVWMTRMSAPVGGRDFATALKQMTAVAAPFYGTQQPKMVLEHPAEQKGG